MNARKHLQLSRLVRVVAATVGVGLLLPVFISGDVAEVGWLESAWIIAAFVVAFVIPGMVQSAVVARCEKCEGLLKVKTATYPQQSDKTGCTTRKEHRYWCSNCKTANQFPANAIDSLFTWESQSNSCSNSSSSEESFGE